MGTGWDSASSASAAISQRHGTRKTVDKRGWYHSLPLSFPTQQDILQLIELSPCPHTIIAVTCVDAIQARHSVDTLYSLILQIMELGLKKMGGWVRSFVPSHVAGK